jgi:pimeloyl-ACP methyl ester carboxylesterase
MNRRGFVSALAVAGAIAVADVPTACSAPQKTGPPPKVKNVVLVHGAYADGSCWADVIPYLHARGMNVASVQNPLRTLEEDVEFAQRALALMDGPTVLVGHSYSGMIVTQAGVDPKVAASCTSPPARPMPEDYTALAKKFPTPAASAGLITAPDGYAQLSQEAFLKDFAQDVDPTRAKTLYAVQGRISGELFTGRVTQAAWRTKPSSYAVSKNDRTIDPDLE